MFYAQATGMVISGWSILPGDGLKNTFIIILYMYTLQIRTTWGEIDACIFLTALNTCTSAHTSSTGGHHSWQHLLLSTRASYAEGDCVLNKRRWTVRQNNEQLWNHHLRHPSHSASFFALWPMILTVNGDRRSCIFWVLPRHPHRGSTTDWNHLSDY